MNPWIANTVILAATVVMVVIRAPHGRRSRGVKVARSERPARSPALSAPLVRGTSKPCFSNEQRRSGNELPVPEIFSPLHDYSGLIHHSEATTVRCLRGSLLACIVQRRAPCAIQRQLSG